MEKLPNLYELSEERKNLKEIVNNPEETETVRNVTEEVLKDNKKEVKGSIKKHGGLSSTKKHYKEEKTRSEKGEVMNIGVIENELGPTFNELLSLKEKEAELKDFEIQRLRASQGNSSSKKMNERLLKQIQKDKEIIIDKISSIENKDGHVSRAVDLIDYKEGLSKEGHIAPTPSVVENLDKIGRRMINGKSMFLHGPTGTGKTSLARFAARHFTGNDAEMVYCNPQTRESNIWGKTGIRPTESGGIQTVDIFGPLAKAMQEGRVIVFDEFTALPKEQMVFIKGIFNAKVGDSVNIVGNGKVEIINGFQMIFTANLKSEKNPERQELPPEIAREFEQNNLEVGYTPKEEVYDIMLARLMNADGSVDISWYDLNTTLPKLCEAMEEIQIAYTDKVKEDTAKQTGTFDASGKRQGLKKFVITQGTIEAILEAWNVEKQMDGKRKKSFIEFLDERLATGLTFKEYPEVDRILATKILASKGFLKTKTPEDLDLPKNVFDATGIKSKRVDKDSLKSLKADSLREVHVSIKELVDIDPFGLRKKSAEDIANQFLNPEGEDNKFIKDAEKRLKKILGEKEVGNTIVHGEYISRGVKGNVLNTEAIEFDIEKTVKRYLDLYKETNITLSDDFEEQILDIWGRNYDEIQKAVEEKGFDEMIIVPANIPLDEIKEKMKMQNGYYTGSNFDSGGGFTGARSTGIDKPRIILTHKSQNLEDRPELKATLGKKAQDLSMDDSLSLEDYIIFQRSYFKETGKHLDEKGWTWLLKTKSGSRCVDACWGPAGGRLVVGAGGAGDSDPDLGCRASRYFT